MSKIPQGWIQEKLGKKVKLVGGYAFKSNDFSVNGIPLIRISNIKNGSVDIFDPVYIDKEIKVKDEFVVKYGDVLIAMSGATTGKIGKYNLPNVSYLNQRVGKFKIKNDIEQEFLNYLVSTDNFKDLVLLDAIGGAQPNISGPQIESIQFLLPPLREQKKIAEILSSVDTVIELTEIEIDKLKNLKKGMMQDLLTKGIGHTKFKDSPLGKIPESWKVVKLEKLLTVKHGYAFEGEYFTDEPNGKFLLTPGHFFEEGGFKHLGIKQKYFNGPIPEDYILKEGNVLIAMTEQAHGLLGSAAKIPGNNIYLHNQRLGKITIRNETDLFDDFIYLSFNSEKIRNQIVETASGTKVQHTSPSKIYDCQLALPPYNEQVKISQAINSVISSKKEKKYKLEKLKNIKKGLMNDLLTGKVRVKV